MKHLYIPLKILRNMGASCTLLIILSGCAGNDATQDSLYAQSICQNADGSSLLGCTTRRNIAALADDPADLQRPRRESPRDAVRRDAVINGYAESRAQGSQPSTALTAQSSPSTGGDR